MTIKILGPGCPNCLTLEQRVRDVVAAEGLDAEVSKVDDIMDIMAYGVMTTPALVVDEKVLVKGRVPTAHEITQLLKS
ncbi:MAG: TM0996/MTH895 family glutaredoxin-like protein [Bacteroidetes bacterium]|nr:TM0996/MTH895 family glutaredoxin-like protein [Bacteroidota bacterium]